MASPSILTPRLVMRPPLMQDLDGWAEFSADPLAMRFLGGAVARSEAWRSLAGAAGSWALQGFGLFSVLLGHAGQDHAGQWIGRVGPLHHEGWPAPEIGYGLLPRFQGQGYAREAVIAAANFAFDRLGWQSIAHVIDPLNTASIRVARSIGSRLLGPTSLPAPYLNRRVDLWGQGHAEWQARLSTQTR